MEAYIQWIWVAAVVLFAIAEAATTAMVSLWFMGGALVAFLLAVFSVPLWIQVTAFVLVSLAFLIVLRPWMKRFVESRKTPTNVDSLVGKIAPVKEDIDNLGSAEGIEDTAQDELGMVPTDAIVIQPGQQ